MKLSAGILALLSLSSALTGISAADKGNARGYPLIECIGADSGNFYDLEILDVGDEEGRVTVNNGAAPQHFDAIYDRYSDDLGLGRQKFLFDGSRSFVDLELEPTGIWLRGKVEFHEGVGDGFSSQGGILKEKVFCVRFAA